jgi:hypothetical protein
LPPLAGNFALRPARAAVKTVSRLGGAIVYLREKVTIS